MTVSCLDLDPADPCSPSDAHNKGGQGFCSKHYQRRRYHGTLPELRVRECGRCGEVFTPKIRRREGRSLYCSEQCADRARGDRRKTDTTGASCRQCGADISLLRSNGRYCSDPCAQKWRRQQRLGERNATCRGCLLPVPTSRKRSALYCSNECKIKSRRHEAYGLTKAELDLLLEQGDQCRICGTDDWGKKGPHVDHDHVSGAVRGILCSTCNTGLGHFKDRIDLLGAAIMYLKNGASI